MVKVLLVDDNQLIGKLVPMYLKGHGCEVEVCNGPFGVLNKVKEFTPDVILLDLNMPGLGGIKLAELLKSSNRAEPSKIILFSSEEESLQTEMVHKGLADDYFMKTHTLDGLMEKIENITCPPITECIS